MQVFQAAILARAMFTTTLVFKHTNYRNLLSDTKIHKDCNILYLCAFSVQKDMAKMRKT